MPSADAGRGIAFSASAGCASRRCPASFYPFADRARTDSRRVALMTLGPRALHQVVSLRPGSQCPLFFAFHDEASSTFSGPPAPRGTNSVAKLGPVRLACGAGEGVAITRPAPGRYPSPWGGPPQFLQPLSSRHGAVAATSIVEQLAVRVPSRMLASTEHGIFSLGRELIYGALPGPQAIIVLSRANADVGRAPCMSQVPSSGHWRR